MIRNPCAVHGPIPVMLVSSASTLSSGSFFSLAMLRFPFWNCSATARIVSALRAENPALRITSVSAASSWVCVGSFPPKLSVSFLMMLRVAATEICWPAIWKMIVPKASIFGSVLVQARGS